MPMNASQFGRRLLEACQSLGVESQKDMVKALGVSPGMFTCYKNGEKMPSMSKAVEIAEKTGVTVEWLLTGREPKHPIDPDNYIDISDLTVDKKATARAVVDAVR